MTRSDFEIQLPEVGQDLDQDEEWREVSVGGERRRIRFHDYHEIYDIPGFYERLFYDKLTCESPPRDPKAAGSGAFRARDRAGRAQGAQCRGWERDGRRGAP